MARIYSEQRVNFQFIVPGVTRDHCPEFKAGSALTKNAKVIEFAMHSDEFTIQLEPGEEYLVSAENSKARILFPSGTEVDKTVFTAPEPITTSYVKLDTGAPPEPAADPVLMCNICGAEFDGKMSKALYAKHMKQKHRDG